MAACLPGEVNARIAELIGSNFSNPNQSTPNSNPAIYDQKRCREVSEDAALEVLMGAFLATNVRDLEDFMTVTLRNFVMSILLVAVLALPLAAQQGNGAITGRVSDNSAALIPGVAVTLTSTSVMGERNSVTDERGAYRFDQLPLGTYTLKFELPGFATLIREGIQITAGFTANINVTLSVASVAETVTVTGQSPVVDTQSSTVAVNLTPEILTNLPTGRDMISMAGISPGIMVRAWDVGGSQVGTSTGFRTYGTDGQTYDMLDGVIIAANLFGDFGSIQEVQVVTAAKSAEAKVAGAYVNKIVKTGSNNFHGGADVYWETPKLQGNNLNDRLKSLGVTGGNRISSFTDVNADVGGPFKKDKFWWYFSARHNRVALFSPGFRKGGCDETPGCTAPVGTFVADNASNEEVAFFTDLPSATLKMNYQVNQNNQVSVLSNWNDKHQPYRGGFGNRAQFFNGDSVARQRYPTLLGKALWTSVLNTRITVDTSYNVHNRNSPYDRRVNEYSRRDVDTQLVRGGFSGENTGLNTSYNGGGITISRQNNLQWQYNIFNMTLLADNLITGTHNIKTGLSRNGYSARQSEDGTVGHMILFYTGGFRSPLYIDTLDTPFTKKRAMKQWSYYINDTWNVARRLTLGLGFRFDQTTPYLPEQEKTGIGPFQAIYSVSRKDLPTLNGPVPRFSLIYDIFGNGKTALKASYGKYVTDPESSLADSVNPVAVTSTRYNWDATGPATNCYLTTCAFSTAGRTPVSVVGGRDREVDPNLKFPYTIEYTAGMDHELMQDVSLRLFVVRKFEQDLFQTHNDAIPFSAYSIPVNGVDPGRDGRTGTADDRTLTVYSLEPSFVGRRKDVLRNNTSLDNANTTFDVEIVKRFSNKWQVLTGWDYLFRKVWSTAAVVADNAGFALDPNNLIYNSGERYNTWHAKVMGTYDAPYGLKVSGVFRAAKGEAYGRRWNSPRLNQGTLNLWVEPIGTFTMDNVNILDFRAEKGFQLGENRKLSATFDLFNVLNSAAILGVNNLTGADFSRPTQTLAPRIARLALKYAF